VRVLAHLFEIRIRRSRCGARGREPRALSPAKHVIAALDDRIPT
jgi:hypothetical protein